MGLRGPQKKRTDAESKRIGNPGKRKLKLDETKPDYTPVIHPMTGDIPALTKPVKMLTKAGSKYWDEHAPEMVRFQLLHQVDADLYAAYCNLQGHYQQCVIYLNKKGYTFKSPNGHFQTRPEVSQMNKSLNEANKIGALFGISPKARKAMDIRLATPQQPQQQAVNADPRKQSVMAGPRRTIPVIAPGGPDR